MSAAEADGRTDDLPDYLVRLLDAAGDLPLRHRMPQAGATARRSAVLILFGESAAGPDVLLIEKSAHLRSHAGQPAFPGGGVDPGDDFPVGTALREAQEEAGIDPAGVRVLATLQELYLPPSDRLVVPVVAWWDDPRDVSVGDPQEVARVARVPLAELVNPANRFRLRHPLGYVGPAFAVADMLVWGFTAGLLEAILDAAGLAQPWDERDVRPIPESMLRPYTLPGSGDDDPEGDAAAPTVADPAPDGPPTRTVRPR
ncbi:NUDIX hydrolase [Blastococcus haudaquaticus]|uniref:8-oxo-dGTP pyrophosphatase MutT, NUDIX family n=1 Tax=Blastococcus haudaquaticus TaxID=1938745 RepID=A0A286GZH3_9ACTN|nr:CoA pyrophosphatase [Blastococcus haudaquaticus]SOE00606.1 8-oxo-dGTP pyrophosphatase MutT, NUDIX family [Blastococcus haudaquaticus]